MQKTIDANICSSLYLHLIFYKHGERSKNNSHSKLHTHSRLDSSIYRQKNMWNQIRTCHFPHAAGIGRYSTVFTTSSTHKFNNKKLDSYSNSNHNLGCIRSIRSALCIFRKIALCAIFRKAVRQIFCVYIVIDYRKSTNLIGLRLIAGI